MVLNASYVCLHAMLHFPELDADLEVLGSTHNMGLIEGEVDALLPRVHMATDSLASHNSSSVPNNPPDSRLE
jgi:hypothetical protein